jgi:hypothetical protein
MLASSVSRRLTVATLKSDAEPPFHRCEHEIRGSSPAFRRSDSPRKPADSALDLRKHSAKAFLPRQILVFARLARLARQGGAAVRLARWAQSTRGSTWNRVRRATQVIPWIIATAALRRAEPTPSADRSNPPQCQGTHPPEDTTAPSAICTNDPPADPWQCPPATLSGYPASAKAWGNGVTRQVRRYHHACCYRTSQSDENIGNCGKPPCHTTHVLL